MGTQGSVTFMFSRQGVIVIEREDVDEDQLMEDALEAGAADFLTDDTDIFEIRTEPNDVGAVRDELEGKGYKILSSERISPSPTPAWKARRYDEDGPDDRDVRGQRRCAKHLAQLGERGRIRGLKPNSKYKKEFPVIGELFFLFVCGHPYGRPNRRADNIRPYDILESMRTR